VTTVVVIPAFNEAQTVGTVVEKVREKGFDVVVVDDGSRDETALQAAKNGATVLRHVVNRGYGAALTTGSSWALLRGYEIVVHFDADGQHDAGEISTLIDPIRNGEADVTIGSRFLGEVRSMTWSRKTAVRLAIQFTRLFSGVSLTDAHNGFRALSIAAVRVLNCREDGMAYASEVVEKIARQNLRLREVPVTVTYTEYSMAKGESNVAKLGAGLRFLWTKFNQ
jgi:glycosyltransferase involved in cell wall biosynthesis